MEAWQFLLLSGISWIVWEMGELSSRDIQGLKKTLKRGAVCKVHTQQNIWENEDVNSYHPAILTGFWAARRSGKLSAPKLGEFYTFVSFQRGERNVIECGTCVLHPRGAEILGCSSILAALASCFHGDAKGKMNVWVSNTSILQRSPDKEHTESPRGERRFAGWFSPGIFSQGDLQEEDTGGCHPPSGE